MKAGKCKKRIITKKVEKGKKCINTNKAAKVVIKKRVGTRVKNSKTPVNTKKRSGEEVLIMLRRRPEIVSMGIPEIFSDEFACQFADYLKFLVVKGIEKDFNTMKMRPPRPMVDSFWQAHILDTAAYHATCVHLFGQYVHRKPRAPVLKMDIYWDAHHKHFPRDALDRLCSSVPTDDSDGDGTEEYNDGDAGLYTEIN